MVSIDVAPRPHEIIEDVYFGDDGPYTFTATKTAGMLSALLSGGAYGMAKLRWLQAGFDEDDWAGLDARLNDPDDPLAAEHLHEMADALLEEVTNRPPTLPTASSGTRPAQTGAGKPKRRASTSGE